MLYILASRSTLTQGDAKAILAHVVSAQTTKVMCRKKESFSLERLHPFQWSYSTFAVVWRTHSKNPVEFNVYEIVHLLSSQVI